jgi:hypothetical protein
VAESFGPLPPMHIEKTGYGAGQRDLEDRPNLLRVIQGTPADFKTDPGDQLQTDEIIILETCIDDMNPEIFGYLMEKLFEEDALDVCFSPVMMKKNRPGTKVQVLCPLEKQANIARCLFAETSTIGVRYHLVHRHTLKRSISEVTTCFGEIQVKCTTDPDGRKRYSPEYEACKKIALINKVPLKRVYEAVANAGLDGSCAGKSGE